jgi:hypothetical protein
MVTASGGTVGIDEAHQVRFRRASLFGRGSFHLRGCSTRILVISPNRSVLEVPIVDR